MSQPSLRLYRSPLSGHSHRVQLFASLLGLPIELVTVNLLGGEHKQPAFLAKNSLGQVPVLEDGAYTLADSNAILVYLAEQYDTEQRYWPRSVQARAQVQRWLSVAAGQLHAGPCTARLIKLFNAPFEHALAVRKSHELFSLLEVELSARSFLVGETATVADVALYSYTAHAPEGGVSLDAYPAVRAWLTRIEGLRGFVPMQRTPAKS